MAEMMLGWTVRVRYDGFVWLEDFLLPRAAFLLRRRWIVRNLLEWNVRRFSVKSKCHYLNTETLSRLTIEVRFRNVHSRRLGRLLCQLYRQLTAAAHKAHTRSSSREKSGLARASPGPTIRSQLHSGRIVELKIF